MSELPVSVGYVLINQRYRVVFGLKSLGRVLELADVSDCDLLAVTNLVPTVSLVFCLLLEVGG